MAMNEEVFEVDGRWSTADMDQVVCPHCLSEDPEPWDWYDGTEDEQSARCRLCHHTFALIPHVLYAFETRKASLEDEDV